MVEPDVVHAAARAASFEYGRKNKFHNVELVESGTVVGIVPKSWPKDVWDYLAPFKPRTVSVP